MAHSYYFNLFKKFEVLGEVPSSGAHAGTGAGGFGISNPAEPFGSSNRGALLGANPGSSPLWAILNSRAMGNAPFTPVNIGGTNWPTMPAGSAAAWNEFQVNPPSPKLVDAFSEWIIGGKVDDIPNGVIGNKPGTNDDTVAGTDLFVCSVAGDNGERPGTVPSNYWATSLIYLVDPLTGNTVNPGNLGSGSEYYLTAIAGNRGNTNAGRYASPAGQRVQATAWVMVWNSGMSPAVQLPALSNLDDDVSDGTYEAYYLNGGDYDVVGFRLNVQDVFNGLVAAINDSDIDLGGLTAAEWVHAQGAHLCAKVLIRAGNDPWPALGDTPIVEKRIAQKNIAPFAIDLSVTDADPDINWSNFMVGDVIAFLTEANRFDAEMGHHRLTFRPEWKAKAMGLYLGMPLRTFHRLGDQLKLKGFKQMHDPDIKPPFPKSVIFKLVEKEGVVELPPLRGQYIAMSLGTEYSAKSLQEQGVEEVGIVNVEQTTSAPKMIREKKCYEVEQLSVGGLSLEVTAYDPRKRYKAS